MSEAELVRRLGALERDNRRLKGFAFAAIILAAAVAAIYATQPVPQLIRAHAFEVIDDSGEVRAKMGVLSDGDSVVDLRDARGTERAWMDMSTSGGPNIGLGDVHGAPRAVIGEHGVAFYDAGRSERAGLGVNQKGAPLIVLSDPQGYSLDLGSAATENTTTGQTQQTSAASIMMFGKDRRVIWQAP